MIDYQMEFESDGEIKKGPFFWDSNDRFLLYTHLSKMDVKKGDKLKAGDKMGKTGKSGLAYGVKNDSNRHLHFEVLDSENTANYYQLHNRMNAAFFVKFTEADETKQKNNKD